MQKEEKGSTWDHVQNKNLIRIPFTDVNAAFPPGTASNLLRNEARMTADDLGIAERLRRKMGRPARTQSVATRFTEDETLELERAADRRGMTVREWTREALLREARRSDDDPVFTEVVAIRSLLNQVVKPLLAGVTWTPEQVSQLIDSVRQAKRNTAREVMLQYTQPS